MPISLRILSKTVPMALMTVTFGLALQYTMVSCSASLDRGDIDEVLLAEPIVPAAVPCGQQVGVFLEGPGELRAGELLHVDIAVGVGIGLQLDLGLGRRHGQATQDGGGDQQLIHGVVLQGRCSRPGSVRLLVSGPNAHSAYVSELVGQPRRHLVRAELLLEAHDAEVVDANWIRVGVALVLRVAVFKASDPMAGEGVFDARAERPAPARIAASAV